MKSAAGLTRRRAVDLDSVRTLVGDSANNAFAQTVADRSITVVKDSLRFLPLGRLASGARVLAITIARRPDLAAGTTFDAEMRRHFPGLHTAYVNADDPAATLARLLASADSADLTTVSSYVGQSWDAATVDAPASVAAFLARLAERHTRMILVAFGNPYLLQQAPAVPAYVVAWGAFPLSQRAAAHALLGAIPVTGRLPISIPPYAAFGAGIELAPMPSTTSSATR